MKWQTEPDLALHRLAAQQPAAHQRRDQVHGRAVAQPGHPLELAALNIQARQEQVVKGAQSHQAHAALDRLLLEAQAGRDALLDGAQVEHRAHERHLVDADIVNGARTDGASKAFAAFHAAKGQPRLTRRVAHFAAKVGVAAGRVEVKDLGYRWASCLKGGDLHFHWKCLMAPLTIIDYVVVHELGHLRHRDHSNAFWNEVDQVLPDYQRRKEWLRVRGVELDIQTQSSPRSPTVRFTICMDAMT